VTPRPEAHAERAARPRVAVRGGASRIGPRAVVAVEYFIRSRLMGQVQPSPDVDPPARRRRPDHLRVKSRETARVLDVRPLVDRDRRRRRDVRAVEVGVVLEVLAVHLAVAVELVHAEDARDLLVELLLEVRVEVDVGHVHRLAETIGDLRIAERVAGIERTAQESFDVLPVGPRHGEGRAPASAPGLRVVPQRQVKVILVLLGVGRVVVRIERNLRRERGALERERRRRVLVDDRGVEVDVKRSRAEIGLAAVEQVGAIDLGAVVLESGLVVPGRDRVMPGPGRGQLGEAVGAERAVAPPGRAHLDRGRTGGAVDHVDDSDERRRPVEHRRRAAHDLDPVDVRQVEGRKRRIERAAPRHVVNDEQEGVELAQPHHLRHGACGSAVASGRDAHAHHERQGIRERAGLAALDLLAGDDLHRCGDLDGILGEARRGDLDHLLDRRRDGRLVLRSRDERNDRQQTRSQDEATKDESAHRDAPRLFPSAHGKPKECDEPIDLLPDLVDRFV